MQFDPLRAFPYPVLRPGSSDYLDSAVQTVVDFAQSTDNLEITADAEISVGVEEIRTLIKEGKAQYAVVFACRDTYFRRSVLSREAQLTERFAAGSLRGDVLIYPYVVATERIENFHCHWINSEFGPGPFSFPSGAVLVADEPQRRHIDRETFQPISSCFDLVARENIPSNEWQIDASDDKVRIAVSLKLKERIDNARNSKENRAILINSIYFAAVVQCLALLGKDGEIGEQRWAKIFRERLADQHLDLENQSETWLAQQLMRHPFTIVDRYFFGESAE